VGVSSGDVIYGPTGAQHRVDFHVIGDVVNSGAAAVGKCMVINCI
jgi:class 3 adenylate cyclase